MSVDRDEKPRIPIGVDSFKKICDGGYCYVDKTLFIKEVLDVRAKATLFTRPHRFGKTLNMSMLQTFFEKTDEDTSRYFKDKKIWKLGPEYTDQQGKYPVISVSFADAKGSWEESCSTIVNVLQAECRRHLPHLDMDALDRWTRRDLDELLKIDPDVVKVKRSLVDLSRILYYAYGTRSIILIDDYDTPIVSAWESGDADYAKRMADFMQGLLAPTLKSNDHLQFGFMTGVVNIVLAGTFGGLNNLLVEGVLDRHYNECFGFTPDEVRMLARESGLDEEKLEEIWHWYQGYRFRDQEMLNPWSVLMYLDNNCKPKAYWADTMGSGKLGEVLLRGDSMFLEELRSLLGGGTIWDGISNNLTYRNLITGDSQSICTLLLMSGYLTTTGQTRGDGYFKQWELRIPNKELKDVYSDEVRNMMRDSFDPALCEVVQQTLHCGQREEMEHALTKFLRQTLSFFDFEGDSYLPSEKECQKWLLGLFVSMPDYTMSSNVEGYKGWADVCLRPLVAHAPGLLIGLNFDKDEESTSEKLKNLAIKAIRQIRQKGYADDMRAANVSTILEFGVGVHGKNAFVIAGHMVPET